MSNGIVYTVGGTVQASGGIYLARPADEQLLQLCRSSEFAYLLSTRQIGKSSLIVRTAQRLAEAGLRSVIVDLNQLGTASLSAEQWYFGLLQAIADQLSLTCNLAEWWDSQASLGAPQRFTLFFPKVVLAEVTSPVVIFLDEIEATLGLPFSADDFYAAIRYFYNARAQSPELRRLSFVLVGVATPSDLIRDPLRTPFNVGERVELNDFTFEEALPLANGLGLPADRAAEVLRWVLKWTGGHPYLTQRLCQDLWTAARAGLAPARWTEAAVDREVASLFCGPSSDRDSNLQFVRDMLTRRAPDIEAVLDTYRAVLRRRRDVIDEERSLVKSHLKLSGVVRRDNGYLRVRNAIYARVFDEHWIARHRPVNWPKRLQQAALALLVTLFVLSIPTAAVAVYKWIEASRLNEQLQDANEKLKTANEDLRKERQLADARFRAGRLERLQANLLQASVFLFRTTFQESLRSDVPSLSAYESLRDSVALLPYRVSGPLFFLEDTTAVQTVAFSPGRDRYLLATAYGYRGELWETDQTPGRKLFWRRARTLNSSGGAAALAFRLPEGRSLALAAANTVTLWDVQTGKEIRSFPHDDEVSALAWSPDGKSLATVTKTGRACLWEPESGKRLADIAPRQDVLGVAFSPDGKYLATAEGKLAEGPGPASGPREVAVELWELLPNENKPVLRTSFAHPDDVFAVAFSPDGKFLATGCRDNYARVWDLTDRARAPRRMQHDKDVLGVAFCPTDGRYLATGGEDNTARVWQWAFEREVARMIHESPAGREKVRSFGIAFTPDGKYLATCSPYNPVQVWEATWPGIVARARHEEVVTAVAFGPGETPFVVTAGADRKARVWQFNGLRAFEKDLEHYGAVLAAAVRPDGALLATAGEFEGIQLWNLRAPEQPPRTIPGTQVRHLVFTHDGKHLLAGSGDGFVHVCDPVALSTRTIPVHSPVRALALSRDDGRLAVATGDGRIRLATRDDDWSNLRPTDLSAGEGRVSSLAFSRVGPRRLAAGTELGTVRVWDLETGKPLPEEQCGPEKKHDADVVAIAFHPENEDYMATASYDYTVQVWNLARPGAIGAIGPNMPGPRASGPNLPGPSASPPAITPNMPGPSASEVHFLRPGAIARITHENGATAVAFSEKGTCIASASRDRTAQWGLWHASDLIRAADERLTQQFKPGEVPPPFGLPATAKP
jgi:WD40 repeat protein